MPEGVIDLAERRAKRTAHAAVCVWYPLVRVLERGGASEEAWVRRRSFRRCLAWAARDAMALPPGHPLQQQLLLALVTYLRWTDDPTAVSVAAIDEQIASIARRAAARAS